MFSAHKTDEEKKEFFDEQKVFDQKVSQLAELIKKSEHFIVFTGAGISTSSGIADFRSGLKTVLKTGPGMWEKQAQQLKTNKNHESVSMNKAIPSLSHMALVGLEKQGCLKYLISQNLDGLHLRSDFPPTKLSELHGNRNLEICKKCGAKYMRDFRTRSALGVNDHQTTRKCDNLKCQGTYLFDTIVNFGENLPKEDLNNAFMHSKQADLCLCLGSSLTVTPAADIPMNVALRKQNLVIVNLQKTPLDKYACIKINGFCDDVMRLLMQKLKLKIPEMRLVRRIVIEKIKIQNIQYYQFRAIDKNKKDYTCIKNVFLSKNKAIEKVESEAFQPFKYYGSLCDKVEVRINFLGGFEEPVLKLSIDFSKLKNRNKIIFFSEFNPYSKLWENVYQEQF